MDIDTPEAEAPAKHKGGWPKGKPRTRRTGETIEAAQQEPVRSTVRERKRKGGSNIDRFGVPPGMIPDGMSWEWKRETTTGKPDPTYMAFLYDQGWEPVEQERYPTFPVRRDGLILMERPMELTIEARAEEKAAARDAVRQKERQLYDAGDGEFARKNADGSPAVKISTTIERMAIE